MSPKIYPNQPKKVNQDKLVYEVVRPHRKKLSRYKLKKQTGIIQQIIDDAQIMGV